MNQNTHCKGSKESFQRSATEGEARTPRRGAAQSKRRGRRPSQPLAGAPQRRCRLTGPRPPWKPEGSPQAAHTGGRCAGPAFPGARAGAEAWPVAAARNSGLATQRFEPSSTGQRRGAAPPGRRRRRLLTRKDVRGRVPAPGRRGAAAGVPRKARLAAAVYPGPAGRQAGRQAGRHTVAGTGGALTQRHGRAAAGVRSSGPRDTTAAPRGLRAKLPPLPPPSPRSASAAPRRSLRAITYRADLENGKPVLAEGNTDLLGPYQPSLVITLK
ncbi:hypothetical protein NN561_016798 [Cricetulus griseus]